MMMRHQQEQGNTFLRQNVLMTAMLRKVVGAVSREESNARLNNQRRTAPMKTKEHACGILSAKVARDRRYCSHRQR
jgi:hypothetical protein